MSTTTIYADQIQIIDESNPNWSGTAATISGTSKRALLHFSLPAGLEYKPITKIELYLYMTPVSYYTYDCYVYNLTGPFDSSVTFNTAPQSGDRVGYILGSSLSAGYSGRSLFTTASLQSIFDNGLLISPIPDHYVGNSYISTSTSTNPPYLVVTHEDADATGTVSGSPSGGYLAKGSAPTFRWAYTPPANIYGTITVTGSDFNYKKASGDAYTQIDTGGALSYALPAGTLSDTNTLIWYPAVTLSTGQRIYPQYAYTISTVEPLFTATPVAPDGTLEDGSAPILFSWTASNSAGTRPASSELQVSYNGGSGWGALATVSGSSTTYSAPAGTISAGTVMWRVRSITSEGNAGSWSSGVSFVCVSAPATPSVNSDAAPFATITWEGSGQQAYEVAVDGVSYGVRFGTVKSFTLPQPLSDGNHTATVKIQGIYGLWSQPGSVVFTVSNSPGGTLTLSGVLETDATLHWSGSAAGSDFLIFRDDVQIGHTALNSFTDRRSLGVHSWYVLLREADGNYTKSNVISGTLSAPQPLIAPLAGGDWIPLRLTENSLAVQTFNYARTHTLRHFSGSAYPVLELSPYEEFAGSLTCAFTDEAEAQAFEALRGQVVIVKSRDTVLIGGLVGLSKARNTFYMAYEFTIQQIATEEILDDPDS